MPISSDTILVRDKNAAAVYLDGNVIVLSLHAGCYFAFNDAATDIWDMLAGPCPVGEIFNELLGRYEVDEKTLSAHVNQFLDQLTKARLVQIIL